MASFFIGLFSVILIILCVFIVLLVLMQRSSTAGGMGAAMGGGAMESAFGPGSANILTRWTIYMAVGFFLLATGLYLAVLARENPVFEKGPILPEFEVPAQTQQIPSEEVPSQEDLETIPSEEA
jgi:preprotein translocase subunit SecG